MQTYQLRTTKESLLKYLSQDKDGLYQRKPYAEELLTNCPEILYRNIDEMVEGLPFSKVEIVMDTPDGGKFLVTVSQMTEDFKMTANSFDVILAIKRELCGEDGMNRFLGENTFPDKFD